MNLIATFFEALFDAVASIIESMVALANGSDTMKIQRKKENAKMRLFIQ